MWPYVMMFAVPAIFALAESARFFGRGNRLAWWAVVAVLTVLIGYRFQVGGDWETYLFMFDRSSQTDFGDYIFDGDASYQLLNWISNRLGWGIYGVNLMTGAIFAFGLVSFCRAQLQPWLALAVAVPYLIIVVAMGYSRQAAALGFEMLALNALSERRAVAFIVLVVAGSSFHKTAIILSSLLILVAKDRRQLLLLLVSFGFFGVAIFGYVLTAADSYSRAYLDTSYESQGTAIRLMLNLVPATLMLVYRRSLGYERLSRRVWMSFSLLSIICLLVFFVSPSSTAVDRVALYLLPLQIAIFSRLPVLIALNIQRARQIHLPQTYAICATAIIVMSYGLVELVWLTRAQTAFAWLPYRSYLVEMII